MKKRIIIIDLFLASIVTFQSCKKDKTEVNFDAVLYSEITSGGFTYYQSGNLLTGASPSPHGDFKLRFNSTALAALDSTGELSTGSSFPAGSIIVKEVFSDSTINLYAVMKKDPSNVNAGNGWVWAEYRTDGSVVFTTVNKGNGCISCHSGTPNRDLVRTFDLH